MNSYQLDTLGLFWSTYSERVEIIFASKISFDNNLLLSTFCEMSVDLTFVEY